MVAGERQMEIRYLEEFIAQAHRLSFGEAALGLNMAQSTLSKHIHALEAELGGELFTRSTRRMELSALGAFYLPYAREISALYASAGQKTRAFLSENGSGLTLGAVHNIQYFGFERYIVGFREACPECRFNVVEGEENELAAMFLRREINLFTTCVFEGETAEHEFLPLSQGHMVAVLPEEHRLAGCYALSLGQLKNENLLLPTRNTKMRRALDAAFAQAGVTPRVVYEGGSTICAELVKSGMGISLQPREAAVWRPDPALCCVDVKPFISYRCGLGCRAEQSLSVPERKLTAYLRQPGAAGVRR